MSLTLHQAIVPSYLQILRAVAALLDKAEAYCQQQQTPPESVIQARLAEDMLPFAYQVKSMAHHSAGALEGVRAGLFMPDANPPPETFAGLRERMAAATATATVEAWPTEELNAAVGAPVRFEYGNFQRDFIAEEFLFSFSQPNFYFHAATAYDILRWQGLPIGKGDFMGRIRSL